MSWIAAGAILLAFGAALTGVRAAGAYKVVVHSDNPLASISRKDLSAIFLKRRSEWSAGMKASPVDQLEESPVRDAFSRDVHGRKSAAVKSYWLQIVFSGRGIPPPEKENDGDVLAFVRAKPGAVGYVSAGAPTDAVRVLRVEP